MKLSSAMMIISSGLFHVKGERVKFFLPGPLCSAGNPLTVSPLHHQLRDWDVRGYFTHFTAVMHKVLVTHTLQHISSSGKPALLLQLFSFSSLSDQLLPLHSVCGVPIHFADN